MGRPLVLGVCENDLQRDMEFLRAFAGHYNVGLSITPMKGPVLTDKTARLLRLRLENALAERFAVSGLLIHVDADTKGYDRARKEARRWLEKHRFQRFGLVHVVCVPDPCLEHWLCRSEGLKGRSAPAGRPCDGWKKPWQQGRGIDLDRVRAAARTAATRLVGLEDFDLFFQDWQGLLVSPD